LGGGVRGVLQRGFLGGGGGGGDRFGNGGPCSRGASAVEKKKGICCGGRDGRFAGAGGRGGGNEARGPRDLRGEVQRLNTQFFSGDFFFPNRKGGGTGVGPKRCRGCAEHRRETDRDIRTPPAGRSRKTSNHLGAGAVGTGGDRVGWGGTVDRAGGSDFSGQKTFSQLLQQARGATVRSSRGGPPGTGAGGGGAGGNGGNAGNWADDEEEG